MKSEPPQEPLNELASRQECGSDFKPSAMNASGQDIDPSFDSVTGNETSALPPSGDYGYSGKKLEAYLRELDQEDPQASQ